MADGTLYVAVSDSDKQYAGYDGAAQTGGIGRWRVGLVHEWVAQGGVPLAIRDKETGLILSGYLEEVLDYRQNDEGVMIATKTKQIFQTRAQWNRENAARRAKAKADREQAQAEIDEALEPETVAPTEKALKVAGGKRTTVDEALRGGRKQESRASPDRVLQGKDGEPGTVGRSGRAADRTVG